MSDSPARVVERYVIELYNEQRIELVPELCADPVVRHAAGATTSLTVAEQTERIRKDLAAHDPKFTIVHLFGDDTHASLTWDVLRQDGERLCGIEIFEVRDGLITDVWNPAYGEGKWA